MKIGDTVRWISNNVLKEGRVIDFIEPNQSAYDSIPFIENVKSSHMHFSEFSAKDRVLIEVEKGKKYVKTYYYCPLLNKFKRGGKVEQ